MHVFGTHTQLLGIGDFTEKKRLKTWPSFLFILKGQLISTLAQRETSPFIFFSASVSILDRIAKTWFDTFPQSLNVAET